MTNCDDLRQVGLQQKRTTTIGSFFASFVVIAGVIFFAIFISNALFGKNSLEVLFSLQDEQRELEKNIHIFKKENAALQKEYLEYKILMPNEEIK